MATGGSVDELPAIVGFEPEIATNRRYHDSTALGGRLLLSTNEIEKAFAIGGDAIWELDSKVGSHGGEDVALPDGGADLQSGGGLPWPTDDKGDAGAAFLSSL